MYEHKRDKTKVDPASATEEEKPAPPLETVPPGEEVNATTAVIPGTGKPIKDDEGKEVKRVVTTYTGMSAWGFEERSGAMRALNPICGGTGWRSLALTLFLLLLVGSSVLLPSAEPPRPKLVATLTSEGGLAMRVTFSPDGKTLAVAQVFASNEGEQVALWEVAARQPRASLIAGTYGWGLAFAPDGKSLASAEGFHTMRLWDLASGKEKVSKRHSESVSEVAFSPDGKLLAFGDMAGTVTVLDAADGKELTTLQGKAHIYSLAFSPDGRTLATADSLVREPVSGEVRLWDVAGWKTRATFGEDLGVALRRISFSPDGKTLAAADHLGKVYLWDLPTGRLRVSWEAGRYMAHCLAYSPDGRVLVTGGGPGNLPGLPFNPGKVMFWDAASGKEILTLEENSKGIVNSLALSPDGRLLAVACGD